mmetsp:Transcript_70770/g.220786  ORF Transcript_70770/g.220786 Transcript_70770/m.220786 type:complete len:240 (+) Transcript_70770:3-722(+)
MQATALPPQTVGGSSQERETLRPCMAASGSPKRSAAPRRQRAAQRRVRPLGCLRVAPRATAGWQTRPGASPPAWSSRPAGGAPPSPASPCAKGSILPAAARGGAGAHSPSCAGAAGSSCRAEGRPDVRSSTWLPAAPLWSPGPARPPPNRPGAGRMSNAPPHAPLHAPSPHGAWGEPQLRQAASWQQRMPRAKGSETLAMASLTARVGSHYSCRWRCRGRGSSGGCPAAGARTLDQPAL